MTAKKNSNDQFSTRTKKEAIGPVETSADIINTTAHKNTDIQDPRLQTIITHTIPVNSLKLMFPKTSQCLHDPKEQQQRQSSGIISAAFCLICPHLLLPILRIFRCLNPFEFFLQIPVKCISRTGMVIR